jgi:glycosyltransferase involved in cell wall biosynthesis
MFIVHIITGLNNGGAEAVLYRLVTNDSMHKHLIISLMDMGKYGPMLQKKGIDVLCLNIPKGKLTVSGVIKLWKALREHKPDVVQTWMYHADLIGGIVAKVAGVRKIVWGIHHTELVPGESSNSTIIISRICAKLSSIVPKNIICCAERAVTVHSELGYNNNKMVVIGNGYELDHFTPNKSLGIDKRKDLNLSNQLLLGMVGRFDSLKDHKNLLQALAILKNKELIFKCLLVGPNMDEKNDQLMAWVEENNLRDNLLLLGPRADIPALMNALDIHILSSLSEGFPNVLAEAMACGTPCITTDVGDAGLIVGRTGWVVPPKDSRALSVAIQQAFLEIEESPKAWGERKLASRQHIEKNFSIETMIKKYHAVWN